MSAEKHDTGKNRLELIPFAALEEIGHVFTYGARKYSDHGFRAGLSWSRLLGAALRHLFAWARGEEVDPESGYSHLAHAGANVLMLIDSQRHKIGTDDRWRKTLPLSGKPHANGQCSNRACWMCVARTEGDVNGI